MGTVAIEEVTGRIAEKTTGRTGKTLSKVA